MKAIFIFELLFLFSILLLLCHFSLLKLFLS